jgi:hypothetical protein
VAGEFWFPINRLYHRNHLNSYTDTDILLLGNTVDNITQYGMDLLDLLHHGDAFDTGICDVTLPRAAP